MRAALITGAGQVEIREFPEPAPAEDGVVVDVALCGVCATDVGAFATGRPYRPAVCGHEWTGTVSATGGSVTRLAAGDRVVVAVPPPCGTCPPCRAGHRRQCATAHAFARGREPGAPSHGGFAPRIAVSADRVVRAHPDLDDETLAQVEPVTVALHAVRQSSLRPGEDVVVQGAGPVGLTTMQCARAAGAGQIIVSEPDAERRALAMALGADLAVDPAAVSTAVDDHTDGVGADVTFECAGGGAALQSAVMLARRGGSVCMVAFTDGPVSIDPGSWLRQEVSVTTALAYVHDEFGDAMDLLADGQVRVDLLHTSTTQLDGLEGALERFAEGRSRDIKVLVNPNWS